MVCMDIENFVPKTFSSDISTGSSLTGSGSFTLGGGGIGAICVSPHVFLRVFVYLP